MDSSTISYLDAQLFGDRNRTPYSVLRRQVIRVVHTVSVFIKKILKFLDYPHHSERLAVKYTNDKDYLYLPEIFSIRRHIYAETATLALFFVVFAGLILYQFHYWFNVPFFTLISGSIALFYLALMIFKLIVVWNSLQTNLIGVAQEELKSLRDKELPTYTIMIPLYREEAVIPQIKKAMTAIDWPADKLDIIITLEEYDTHTREAIRNADLPDYFKILTLPDVKPKTKPKALNVAFPHTKGEYLVIYDAEIIPDPDQLKKAYLAFRNNPDVAVLQTRLDHYNANQNMLTRLFNAEFSFYYDLFLPGLQKMGFAIPLSGHSTHFRRYVIDRVGAWDPYNVAEDCDVGVRLYRMNYKTGILDSTSREEATSTADAWIRQRTRWMKGFIQTSIVHLRHPFRFMENLGGPVQLLGFLFTVPGSVLINAFNLFYWLLLIAWLTTHSPLIQILFPGVILTISVLSFVVGNFVFTFLNLIGAFKRGRYALVKWCLLSPLYWLILSYATVKASIEIIIRPHHWEKTVHNAHLTA